MYIIYYVYIGSQLFTDISYNDLWDYDDMQKILQTLNTDNNSGRKNLSSPPLIIANYI